MEVPSSSPIYTPLKPRPHRRIEPIEPITLFPSDPDELQAVELTQRSEANDFDTDQEADPETQITAMAREESVIRSSDEEQSDTDPDTTHVEDEFRWSLAQRPPPESMSAEARNAEAKKAEAKKAEARKVEAIIENSLAEEEPLGLPSSISSPVDEGEETILSDEDDDDETQHTDSDTTAVGIYDSSQQKSTQNYLSELLTDSLLESLPLPPDRKQHLREVAR